MHLKLPGCVKNSMFVWSGHNYGFNVKQEILVKFWSLNSLKASHVRTIHLFTGFLASVVYHVTVIHLQRILCGDSVCGGVVN